MRFEKATTIVLGVIGVTLLLQALSGSPNLEGYVATVDTPMTSADCIGDPIRVAYPYTGQFVEHHACAVQCDDGIQRYILYSNGKATQCSPVPGCLDWGEDYGVTCRM